MQYRKQTPSIPIDSMTSSRSIKLSHHWSKLLSSDPNPLWVPTVTCITSSPVPAVSIYHSSTTKSNMLYLARCRRPHKKNNTNKPQKKTQTQANKQTKLIYMARFKLNDAVISFLKTHDTWESGSSHPSTFTCLREAVCTYDCNEQTKPFLNPDK